MFPIASHFIHNFCPAGITKVDTQKYPAGKVLFSQNENEKYIYIIHF
jgi:hypothetical protein